MFRPSPTNETKSGGMKPFLPFREGVPKPLPATKAPTNNRAVSPFAGKLHDQSIVSDRCCCVYCRRSHRSRRLRPASRGLGSPNARQGRPARHTPTRSELLAANLAEFRGVLPARRRRRDDSSARSAGDCGPCAVARPPNFRFRCRSRRSPPRRYARRRRHARPRRYRTRSRPGLSGRRCGCPRPGSGSAGHCLSPA